MTEAEFEAIRVHATGIAETKADAVLRAMVILHIRLVSGLVAKGVLTKSEHAASISSLQELAVGSRPNAPELFDALSTATMMIGEAFGEPPSGAPS